MFCYQFPNVLSYRPKLTPQWMLFNLLKFDEVQGTFNVSSINVQQNGDILQFQDPLQQSIRHSWKCFSDDKKQMWSFLTNLAHKRAFNVCSYFFVTVKDRILFFVRFRPPFLWHKKNIYPFLCPLNICE